MTVHLARCGTLCGVVLLGAAGLLAQVSGRVTVVDGDDRPADDTEQAVVWLEGAGLAAAEPVRLAIGTEGKQFLPHVAVVPAGSTVIFPNHDPFDHNVFSRTEGNTFDLGLYGRGETRSIRLDEPGVVRIYCNVHAQMSAIVVVRDNRHFTQPGGDGSFTLDGIPSGEYTVHAWHERAEPVAMPVAVTATGARDLELRLDAGGFRFEPHLNKFGRPYPKTQTRRRY